MFVSLGMRFVANVEALNMVETIGNLSKHRKAPIIIPKPDGYKVIYVPAISGEAIAHAYQAKVVELAIKTYQKPPLDNWSLRGEFFKFMDNEHLTDGLKSVIDRAKQSKNIEEIKHEFEKTAIIESIIADIGGFLYAEKPPVKRTSVFQVGYVVPVDDAIEATVIESQLHSRQAPVESKGTEESRQEGEEEKERRAAQMLYYVEVGSAVYGLTFNIDLDAIGRTSLVKKEDVIDRNEKIKRMKISILALSELVCENCYGAKRSRFLPIEKIESICVSISDIGNFVVSPPHEKNFIENTYRRAKSYEELLSKVGLKAKVEVHAYSAHPEKVEGVNHHSLPEDVFKAILDRIK